MEVEIHASHFYFIIIIDCPRADGVSEMAKDVINEILHLRVRSEMCTIISTIMLILFIIF